MIPDFKSIIDAGQPIKYGKFLETIEDNMTVLKTTSVSREVRIQLKEALESRTDLNAENRKFENKTFSGLSKFFHKLGQLFKGHGFQTKREYGLQLGRELGEINHNIWRQELTDYLIGKSNTVDFAELRKIPINEFKEAIWNYIQEPASTSGEHRKMKIFNELTEEQKQAVRDECFSQGSWYYPVYRIVKGASKEQINDFIDEAMIRKFTGNPKLFIHVMYEKRQDPFFNNFAQIVILRGFRQFLKDENIKQVRFLILPTQELPFADTIGAQIRNLLKNALTADELTQLRKLTPDLYDLVNSGTLI